MGTAGALRISQQTDAFQTGDQLTGFGSSETPPPTFPLFRRGGGTVKEETQGGGYK